MHWILASLVSAFFLGCYDLATKQSVRENAVLPVLFWANVCSALVWLGLMAWQSAAPGALPVLFHVEPVSPQQHLLLALKSAIVAASWVCSYFAVKHLSVSLAAPIRATGPVWTLFGALLVLGERPAWLQILGVLITIGSFIGLSFAGRGEGVHFYRDKWIWLLVAGTVIGAVSALYDKFLLGRLGFHASTVQAWFAIYLTVIFFPLALGWKFRLWPRNTFRWRAGIPLMALALLAADFLYFNALRDPGALVSLVSSFRRGSTLVAFAGGLLLFHEPNGLQKLPAVLGVLAGIVLTVVG
ncbi:MAG: DMT family transporter [Opitutaceae bacterium]|jgi:drug/metabolite transporter (DMT)-like permease|nr:DMT family transporter [Opitutaceae bacterium]